MIERAQSEAVEGATLHDAEGSVLGTIHQVYADRDSGRPEWAVLDIDGSDRFVPLFPASLRDDGVHVPVPGALVATAPSYDGDAGSLSAGDEADLYAHYGLAPDGSQLEPLASGSPGSPETSDVEAEEFHNVPGGPDPSSSDGLTAAERIQLETNVEASEGYLDDDERSIRARAEHDLDHGRRRARDEGVLPGPDATEVAR